MKPLPQYRSLVYYLDMQRSHISGYILEGYVSLIFMEATENVIMVR